MAGRGIHGRLGATLAVIVVMTAAGSCGGEQGGTAGGEAAVAGEVAALNYEVTPDRYDRWVAAQQALDAIPGLPAPPKIDPMRLDDAEIDRAVQYLEGDPQARAALARAGISARDYVLTTVALDQALVTAEATDPGAGGTPVAPVSPAANPPVSGGGATGTGTTSPPSTPAAGRTAAGGTFPAARIPPAGRARPRFSGTPQQNVELVRRKRADVVRVLRTMRFRVSESAAAEIDAADTSVTRSDSVAVGKDITVKWDVTVRRKRDTTASQKAPARPDSARRDTTSPDSSSPN